MLIVPFAAGVDNLEAMSESDLRGWILHQTSFFLGFESAELVSHVLSLPPADAREYLGTLLDTSSKDVTNFLDELAIRLVKL